MQQVEGLLGDDASPDQFLELVEDAIAAAVLMGSPAGSTSRAPSGRHPGQVVDGGSALWLAPQRERNPDPVAVGQSQSGDERLQSSVNVAVVDPGVSGDGTGVEQVESPLGLRVMFESEAQRGPGAVLLAEGEFPCGVLDDPCHRHVLRAALGHSPTSC
jgi:hypothetical protein